MWLSIPRRAFGGGLLLTAMACAQAPGTLTVGQAVSEALANNANLLAERANIGIAEARVIGARLRPNPVFSAGADHLAVGRFTEINGGGPTEMNLRFDLPVERAGKRPLRVAVAQAAHSVAELNYLNAVRGLALEVRNAFLDAQAARDSLALARESLLSLNRIAAINEARLRAGDLSRVETIRSRLAALQFENSVRQAELRLRSALTRLGGLMGRSDPSSVKEAAGEIAAGAAPVLLDEVRAQALRLRPDLQALRREVARAGTESRLQVAAARPDYTLGTEYRRQQGVNGTSNSLGLFLEIPIPFLDRNQGEIARARQEERQAEARVRALEQTIAAEVHQAVEQHRAAGEMLERIRGTMLQEARQVREITEYSYQRGEASLLEMLDAQRAFNETIEAYNQARAEFARALYLLDAVTGREVQP